MSLDVKNELFWLILFLGGIFLLLACNPATTPNPQNEEAAPTEGNHLQMTPSLPAPADAGLQNLINKAIADLAQRLSIPTAQITLLEATPVVWPDGSLGCPQEGMEYAQVLTPGYLIRLQSGEQEFEYHASRSTTVVFCENPVPPIPGTPADI